MSSWIRELILSIVPPGEVCAVHSVVSKAKLPGRGAVSHGFRTSNVDIYVVDTALPGKDVSAFAKLLPPEELARSRKFREDSLGRRWIVSRAALRSILATYCRLQPVELSFATGSKGKPFLDGAGEARPVNFNLSHSGRIASIAVSDAGPVGVDVEECRAIPDWASVARRCFSTRETDELSSIHEEDRQLAFYACWTRKEAVIKATGEGMSARLQDFDVTVSPAAPARLTEYRQSGEYSPPWHMHSFVPAANYIAAIAIQSWKDVTFTFRTLPPTGAH